VVKPLLILALLFVPSLVVAGDFFDDDADKKAEGTNLSYELNGFTRGVFFGGNVVGEDEIGLTAGYGELDLKCRVRKGQIGDAYADVRFRRGFEFGDALTEFNLREAYVNAYLGNFNMRLGHQIVVWGRADEFNPTNNITPQNMVARSTDLDDRKVGNFLIRSSYGAGPLNFELIWVPQYASSVLPMELFPIPDGVKLGTAILPDATIKNSSFALKAGATLGSVDGSVSWFNGYMPMPGIFLVNESSTGLDLFAKAKSYKMNVFGADFSTSVGSYGLRGEFAYRNPMEDYATVENIFIPNPDFQYVLGVDRSIGNFTIIAQYIGRFVMDFKKEITGSGGIQKELERINRMAASQQDQISHMVMARPTYALFHETCNLEFLGLYNFSTQEVLVRPCVVYNLADALTLKAGWERYAGPDGTLFGNIEDALSTVFVELKASF